MEVCTITSLDDRQPATQDEDRKGRDKQTEQRTVLAAIARYDIGNPDWGGLARLCALIHAASTHLFFPILRVLGAWVMHGDACLAVSFGRLSALGQSSQY